MIKQHAEPVTTTSAGINEERLAQLRQLFPEAFTEGKIDFDKLRQTLGDFVDDSPERYTFTWAGRRDAIRMLQTPTSATLVPAREESISFDDTSHVFIEGENLEVLKLLYKAYFGKVKLIYIDPPYNTGNDFIYPDNYADPLEPYLQLTRQKDASGNLLTSNPDSSGRFHSNWLSMIYPRLFVARQLLRDDGVIFISIDDREFFNLRVILNEIFGEENFLGTIVWKKKTNGNNMGYIPPVHDYFLAYAKNASDDTLLGFPLGEEYLAKTYSNSDGDPRGAWTTSDLSANHKGPYFPIQNPSTGEIYYPPEGRYWVFSEDEVKKRIRDERIIFGKSGNARPVQKVFLNERSSLRRKAESWWDEHGLNSDGTEEIKRLLGTKVFEHAKPSITIEHLCNIASKDDDIVLDFFAGSGTTAHSVLKLNQKDGSHRRFVLVQLPEPTEREQYDAISDMSVKRIKNVIKELQTQSNSGDLGFRIFKLAPSHFKPWTGSSSADAATYQNQLSLFGEPLADGWQPEPVVWEIALKEGYPLHSRLTQASVAGHTVYRVENPDTGQQFHITLEASVTADLPRHLNLTPDDLFVCRDLALNDTTAANLALQCRLKTI